MYSISCLSWLEQVLKERFGYAFVLRVLSDELLSLSLPDHENTVELMAGNPNFKYALSDFPCSIWDASEENWFAPLGEPLVAPGVMELPSPLILESQGGYRIQYDILGLIYWMLSRQEEVGRTDLDNNGRFPAVSSHAYKHDYLERPIIDEWLVVLGQVLQCVWPQLVLRPSQFSIKVSHDVDRPSRYGLIDFKRLLYTMTGDLLRGNIRNAVLAPWIWLGCRQRLHVADPANTFDWIMQVSEKYGLTSAFYFICGQTDWHKDPEYKTGHAAIRELMQRIYVRGHEIGLHPSYNTYRNTAAIVVEAERLRKVLAEEGIQQMELGGRMHYLRWEHPATLYSWEAAGLSYDSTLGYADHAGFRCGTCFEYPAFDPVTDSAVNVRIRPLIAMECTVMDESYMGLGTGDAALNKLLQLKRACSAVNGTFTLLWHNSQLETQEKRELYEQVLAL